MLERALWLFPFGLSVVYFGMLVRNQINHKRSFILSHGLLVIALILSFGVFTLYMLESGLPDRAQFTTKTQRYQGLALAGHELDRRIPEQAFVVGSKNLNDLIPGLSSKAKIITFRTSYSANMSYFTDTEREERISDMQKLFSKSLPPEKKMDLIEKYDISFLFLQPFDLRIFEDFIERYPDETELVDVGGVLLVEINK